MIFDAQGASSSGQRRAAGEDSAADRRVRHARDGVRADDRQIAQVRQRRDADRCADLRIGERVLDRRDQVVDRTVGTLRRTPRTRDADRPSP